VNLNGKRILLDTPYLNKAALMVILNNNTDDITVGTNFNSIIKSNRIVIAQDIINTNNGDYVVSHEDDIIISGIQNNADTVNMYILAVQYDDSADKKIMYISNLLSY
jgi:hypothetical protein